MRNNTVYKILASVGPIPLAPWRSPPVLKVNGYSVHSNLFGRSTTIKTLMPPAYFWLKNSEVVHLVDPAWSLVLKDIPPIVDNDGVYSVNNQCAPNLRCYVGFWLGTMNHAYASRVRPDQLRLCQRCAKVVNAALLDYLRVNLVFHITKAVKDNGIELGYHRWGRTYTSDVRPQAGSIPGTISFYFKSKTHDDKIFSIEIPLLNIEKWDWITVPSSNPEFGQWIGAELVARLEQQINVKDYIQREQVALEEGLFETL